MIALICAHCPIIIRNHRNSFLSFFVALARSSCLSLSGGKVEREGVESSAAYHKYTQYSDPVSKMDLLHLLSFLELKGLKKVIQIHIPIMITHQNLISDYLGQKCDLQIMFWIVSNRWLILITLEFQLLDTVPSFGTLHVFDSMYTKRCDMI